MKQVVGSEISSHILVYLDLIEYLWHLDAASVGFSCRLPIFPREKRGKVQIMGAIGKKKKKMKMSDPERSSRRAERRLNRSGCLLGKLQITFVSEHNQSCTVI